MAGLEYCIYCDSGVGAKRTSHLLWSRASLLDLSTSFCISGLRVSHDRCWLWQLLGHDAALSVISRKHRACDSLRRSLHTSQLDWLHRGLTLFKGPNSVQSAVRVGLVPPQSNHLWVVCGGLAWNLRQHKTDWLYPDCIGRSRIVTRRIPGHSGSVVPPLISGNRSRTPCR